MNQIEESPNPRFTGIFIPVEILELKVLTPFDQILLSWIDALYCKKNGGCFASNKYLAEQLNVKENTLSKNLTKLRRLGLIENVSFDGRKRVIRSTINKYIEKSQSQAACDLNHTLHVTNVTPDVGRASHAEDPTRINTYSKEEIKDKRVVKTSSVQKKLSSMKSKDHSSVSPAAARLSKFLFSFILKIDQKAKTPKWETWNKSIELMINKDGRTEREIEEIIKWVSKDQFWSKNILSTRKLREKFTQLLAAKNSGKKKSKMNYCDDAYSKDDEKPSSMKYLTDETLKDFITEDGEWK